MASFARELDKNIGPAVQAVSKADLSASFGPAQKISHDGQKYAPKNLGQAAKAAHSGIAESKQKLGSIQDARKEIAGAKEEAKAPQVDAAGKGSSLTGLAMKEGMGWAATAAAYAVNPTLGLGVAALTTLGTAKAIMGGVNNADASWDQMYPDEYSSSEKGGASADVYQRYDSPSKDVTQQANFQQQQPSIPQPMVMGDKDGPSYEDSMRDVFDFFGNNPSAAAELMPTEEDLMQAEQALTAQLEDQEQGLGAVRGFVQEFQEFKPMVPAFVPAA